MDVALFGLLIALIATAFIPRKDIDDDFPVEWVQ